MKIALVHEFLTQFGGAERVLQNFLAIWPDAELHVLIHNSKKMEGKFDNVKIKTSYLNNLPMAQTDHKWYLAMMPHAVESFKFDKFDLVLSDSSSFAKGVKAKGKLHICYCHTPTRFLWTEEKNYLDSTKYSGAVKILARPVLQMLKKWDLKAAQRPDFYIANSQNVRERIKNYYKRDAIVIPPPVDTEMFFPDGEKKDYFFAASRLEPYKKVDLIIEAFNDLGWPLKIGGTGTDIERLKKMAKPNVEFLGKLDDVQLRKHYSQARGYIFAAEEDAGIMVMEAMACGTPVIAYGKGGSLESVLAGLTGEFFYEQSPQSLRDVLKNFNEKKYSPEKIREHAMQFDKMVFREKIKAVVNQQFSKFI